MKLKAYYAELEQTVKIRTRQLDEKVKTLEDNKKAILNLLEDVEESKNKEEALAKDLEKFKLAVDNTSDSIIITDPEAIVIYANKAIEKNTGYKLEEVVGKKADVLWKSSMLPAFYQKMWDTIKEQKKTFIGEIQNKRKNKEVYTAVISISPVLNEKGGVEFFVAIERDITKEKDIDKAKTEFVSLASHQLRTPLSAVSWYSEMLLAGDAGKLNAEQKKYLEEVYRGNHRMIDLVNSLLNVSRLELGTFSVEPKPTDIVKVGSDVVREQQPEIKKGKLVLKETYEAGLPEVNVDPKLLHMVFDNLLSNAVKYTPEKGKIDFTIKKESGQMFIAITDTGMGIPKDAQDKIFTKLFRADNVREKDTEGTGLGLYIVKSIVEQSGGKIWFESQENKGTTFYVELPLEGMKRKVGNKPLS